MTRTIRERAEETVATCCEASGCLERAERVLRELVEEISEHCRTCGWRGSPSRYPDSIAEEIKLRFLGYCNPEQLVEKVLNSGTTDPKYRGAAIVKALREEGMLK